MISVASTGHWISEYICDSIATGIPDSHRKLINFCDKEESLISYGHLRGSYEALIESKEFWHIDHGYMRSMKRDFKINLVTGNKETILPSVFSDEFNKSYFRISYNSFFNSGLGNLPEDRFLKLNIKINTKKSTGSKILLIPPELERAEKFYKLKESWIEDTIKEIKKFSDREIIISKKHDINKASSYFKESFVVVTFHSNAGIDAMIQGVPCIFLNKERSFSNISQIERPPYNEKILFNLAYWQWNIHEMKSGEAWNFLLTQRKNDKKK